MKSSSRRGGAINSLQTAEMRPGDFGLRRDDRNLWGNVVQLGSTGGKTTRLSSEFVDTPTFGEPRMFQIEMRVKGGAMGDTGSTFSPILPNLGSYTLRVMVRRALDRDKGVATDVYLLRPPTQGDLNALPVLTVLAVQLGVNVAFEGVGLVTVEANATPVCCGARDAYSTAVITRITQNSASQVLLPANPLRRQFFIQNSGSGPLYVALGNQAVPPGGTSPRWTFILPIGTVYESPRDCYQGSVDGVWDADDPAQYALATEGT